MIKSQELIGKLARRTAGDKARRNLEMIRDEDARIQGRCLPDDAADTRIGRRIGVVVSAIRDAVLFAPNRRLSTASEIPLLSGALSFFAASVKLPTSS